MRTTATNNTQHATTMSSEIKIVFWNVRGLAPKLQDMKSYLIKFNIIILAETFTEEKNINKCEDNLPKGYKWYWTPANRDLQLGRGWGGLLIGVKNGITSANFWSNQTDCLCGIDLKINEQDYNILGVYCRTGVKSIQDTVLNYLDRNKSKKCIIVGDWNARIGELGDERESKDTVVNAEGREFLELLDEFNLHILNGNAEGDWKGEFTHAENGSQSVIDYATVNDEVMDEILNFRIGDQIGSDHFPLEIVLTTQFEEEKPEQKWRQSYTPENILKYQRALERQQVGEHSTWETLKEIMWNAAPKTLIKNCAQHKNTWWNEECYKARTAVKQALRRARADSQAWINYHKMRKDYKFLIRKTKSEWQDRQLQELNKISNIKDAWKYIKRNRPAKQKQVPEDEDLITHFMTLLDGVAFTPIENFTKTDHTTMHNTHTINEEEFRAHLGKMKRRKASGPDELMAEALIHSDRSVKMAIKALMENCLNGNCMPASWRDSIIYPLHKKGCPRQAENYRGIAIGNSVYKLYASIINSRLTQYVEENGLLPDTQNGFRRKRSTIDNIYILNYCAQYAINRGQHLYCAFIDFKAAFDTVNRDKLMRKMKLLNVPEYLIAAVTEIYRSTPYIIAGHKFDTKRGLKQGCPLSPLLFAIYISDVDRAFKNQTCGGVVIGRRKVHALSYADDIVLLADRPSELQEMLRVLERYSERKDMTVNTEKSKVLKFSNGGTKSRCEWKYSGTLLEEVNTFKYLGFTFQTSGRMTAHLDAVAANAKRRVCEVWSLGERMFLNNFIIRKQMYKSLVEPTLLYGCEVFGFLSHEQLEKVQRKYFKWTLGLAQHTRSNDLMMEAQLESIAITTGYRALQYEERGRSSPCELLRECIRLAQNGDRNRFTESRARYCQAGGQSERLVSQQLEEGVAVAGELQLRHRQVERQLRLCAIDETRYGRISTGDRLPLYLKFGRDIKLIARFRLENEEHGRQRWREDKRCRVCGFEEETLEHITDVCVPTLGGVKWLLHELGRAKPLELIQKKRNLN